MRIIEIGEYIVSRLFWDLGSNVKFMDEVKTCIVLQIIYCNELSAQDLSNK